MDQGLSVSDKRFVLAKYKKLQQSAHSNISESDRPLLKDAFVVALAEYGRQTYLNNESYFSHAVDTAAILSADMGMGLTSIISALLLGASSDSPAVSALLNHKKLTSCKAIISDLNKISKLPTEKLPQNAENFVSLILSISSDVRVVLIKLADRLQYMRNIQSLDTQAQKAVANETINLYAPLAHRLGLYKVKSELDELSLNYAKPDIYADLESKIKEAEYNRRDYVNQFMESLIADLHHSNLKFSIKNRTKSVSSVYSKILKQKIEFEEVYDLFAIRIILDSDLKSEKSDCWRAYSVVTNLYKPEISRMRDWVTQPRANGYESLHITVQGPSGNWIEVQIRSKQMDEEAEMGNAAHWRYKGQKGGTENSEWLNSIRKVLESPLPDEQQLLENSKSAVENMVYVFTPEGDLKKLKAGSSVLDFAFEVHTNVGSKCSGAKVNGKIVPLRYVLKSGDRVEVMTSKNQNPNSDWLGWVASNRAKNKIKRFLKEAEFAQAEVGKEILKRKVSQIKNVTQDEAINKLIAHFKLSGALELFQRLAESRIDTTHIKDILTAAPKEEEVTATASKTVKADQKGGVNKTSENVIVVNEVSEIEGYKLARCCNPVMGDKIFGFVTVSEGIKIHRITCPNAARMRSRYPYRTMEAQWSTQVEGSFFIASVKISGFDQLGILNTITNMISQDLKMDVRGISLDSRGGKFDGVVKVSIKDSKHLEFLIKKLLEIKGIIKASRIS